MRYIAEVTVMPLKHLPDHQGKEIVTCTQQMGFQQVQAIRAGKHFRLEINAETKENAMNIVNDLCNKLLCNTSVEGYAFDVNPNP
jgi:phosphoribosylformylglycinamidine synthase subunit PurS